MPDNRIQSVVVVLIVLGCFAMILMCALQMYNLLAPSEVTQMGRATVTSNPPATSEPTATENNTPTPSGPTAMVVSGQSTTTGAGQYLAVNGCTRLLHVTENAARVDADDWTPYSTDHGQYLVYVEGPIAPADAAPAISLENGDWLIVWWTENDRAMPYGIMNQSGDTQMFTLSLLAEELTAHGVAFDSVDGLIISAVDACEAPVNIESLFHQMTNRPQWGWRYAHIQETRSNGTEPLTLLTNTGWDLP